MNIHEYQAKSILKKFGINIPAGAIATTVAEAVSAAKKTGGNVWAVKAQVHAGGRGKGGGIKITRSIDEIAKIADNMLGMQLVTPQTSSEGILVKKIYIEEGCSNIAKEIYLSVLLDRSKHRLTFIASKAGGMDIEEVSAKTPDLIHKMTVDPNLGVQPFHARNLAFKLGLKAKEAIQVAKVICSLYEAYITCDANLIEINPLVITKDKQCLALDAKITFDENSLFRHADIESLRDINEEDPDEYEANQHFLSYIKLDGNIGCMVNGAGLAMATMDVIKLFGGDPANFLDVGGGATKERVAKAFKIILSDKKVKGILINIFGGIMRCDTIAAGIIAAAKELSINIPIVVRLEGTNVELGKSLMQDSGLSIIASDDLGDAAQKIVTAVAENI